MVFSDSPVCTVLVTITAVNFLGGVPAGTGCQEAIWQITLEKQVLLPHCNGLSFIIFFFELQRIRVIFTSTARQETVKVSPNPILTKQGIGFSVHCCEVHEHAPCNNGVLDH